ncbi:MAG: Nucleotide sugar dehydrogenase [candidate division WS6 bacterium GW2011_GWF2_39_15]|uniref:Nucleotide sugar dehydrogenase n=1 Tax=candidate division WS6 bacterium GW2011_GWF2_39_15 TaxID=1619100 RepID=A0A0G0MQ21_9BACT|nr:MAG: Nucleotide sugar dehydrogenase [candidate division WS6 bacterium GW2011_GWF2_39_15]
MKKTKVAVIGLGYVGFPLLCSIGISKKYETIGFDLSASKVELAKKHISPVQDELAESLIKDTVYEVSTDPDILKDTDIFIICVPTPIDEMFVPDYTPVIKASETVAKYIKKGGYIVLESTVNPGTCEEIMQPLLEEKTGMKAGKDFELAHCPERIDPGNTKWNVKNLPRNIGALTKEGCAYLADFYREVLDGDINEMESIKEAEATKIIENAFRDINIAYVNELAKSFDVLGIDLINVIKGASSKFSFMPHYPGPGVGGHCIAVDPYYLIERAKKAGFDHVFLRKAREVNNSMPYYTVERLIHGLNDASKSIKGSQIALLGLSYKKNISDLRESPSLKIKSILEKEYGAKLRIYDPYNLELSTHKTLEEVLKGADAVIIATDHSEFVQHPTAEWAKIPVIVDGRNCLDKIELLDRGVIYKGIGR